LTTTDQSVDDALQARLEQLERRHKLLIGSITHILEARFEGEMPHAAADVVALMGGQEAAASADFHPRIEGRFAQLEQQRAHLTNALRYVLEGRWTGEMPHASAEVVALLGGEEAAKQAGFTPESWTGRTTIPITSRTRGMLDRGNAPDLETAVAAAKHIGAEAWCVYIGGPFYKGTGWTPEFVKQLGANDLLFLPTYVGQQRSEENNWHGTMTDEQGRVDAQEAVALMAQFGWAPGAPVCLDVEGVTFGTDRDGTIAYVGAWVEGVRNAGYRPGVYSNPDPVAAMDRLPRDRRPEFVWVASWFVHAADPNVATATIDNFADKLWNTGECRAWQYAGAFGGKKCQVLEMDVDISITDVVVGQPA
jgi:hypothetical protein